MRRRLIATAIGFTGFILMCDDASAVTRFGLQGGVTWALSSEAGNKGGFKVPALGAHFQTRVTRRFWVHSMVEYQTFDLLPGSLAPGSAKNHALSLFILPTGQMFTSAIGGTYLSLGPGIGRELSTQDFIPWGAFAWGTKFRRRFFIEMKTQVRLDGRITEKLYFSLVLGFHFNPRPENWRESLIREKSGG